MQNVPLCRVFATLLALTVAAVVPTALGAPMPPSPRGAYPVTERCGDARTSNPPPMRHLGSPDWAKQVIYSVQLDRFNDGDRRNNDQGQGEYDPTRESHYSGGDIRGVIDKIDYLKSLGVTTVLLSPFIANKWVDPGFGDYPPYTGYHGYWPVSFVDIDAHVGTITDLRLLASRLHKNGMYLMMDVVANHTAHYYQYSGVYDPNDVTRNFRVLPGQVPPRPTMPPFDRNDVRIAADRAAAIYHWTPPITNYEDRDQLQRYQLELVNDLNTSNPAVRAALKHAYGCWLEQIGFDGLRIDAAKHIEPAFWSDFLYGEDGLLARARRLGKRDLLTYGEVWHFSPPFKTSGEAAISAYVESGSRNGFRAAMGFPLFSSLNKVINADRPTDILAFQMDAQMTAYPDPYSVINFLDSQDVVRFRSLGDVARYRKALAILLTAPGIPLIYQGDEQGFVERRQAMFRGGYKATGDHFDRRGGLFTTVKALNAVRQSGDGVFTRGSFRSLSTNSLGPGAFAFERRTASHTAFVAINTSNRFATLINGLPTGLKPGSTLDLVFGVGVKRQRFVVDRTGRLTFALRPNAIAVLLQSPESPPAPLVAPAQIFVEQSLVGAALHDDQPLSGTVTVPHARLALAIDGNLDAAPPIIADAQGHWQATLPVRHMLAKPHFFELFLVNHGVATAPVRYFADRLPTQRAAITDPLGDDHGPTHDYRRPLHPSVTRQMDITQVRLDASPDELVLRIEMAQLTDFWSFTNGFENVSFQIFIDDPAIRSGAPTLPWIAAPPPPGFDWDVAQIAHGFGNTAYRNDRGRDVAIPAAAPEMSTEGKTLTLRYDCSKLPIRCDHRLKVYVTTWDRDQEGRLRDLQPSPDIWTFGGPTGARTKILDAALIGF